MKRAGRSLTLIGATMVGLMGAESSTSEFRFLVGTASAMKHAEINGIVIGPLTDPYDQKFDFDSAVGLHVGMLYVRSSPFKGRLRGLWGIELAYDDHRGGDGYATGPSGGPFQNGEDINLEAFSVNALVGLRETMELSDNALGMSSWGFECMPYGGLGIGTAHYGNDSDAGLYYRVGVRLGLEANWSTGNRNSRQRRLSLSAGYERAEARVEWDNTDESTVAAQGITGSLSYAWTW